MPTHSPRANDATFGLNQEDHAMPRYFFDIVSAGQRIPDKFGVNLIDDEEAREEVLGLISTIARDMRPSHDQHELLVSARDGRGETVYEATLTLLGRWSCGRNP